MEGWLVTVRAHSSVTAFWLGMQCGGGWAAGLTNRALKGVGDKREVALERSLIPMMK